MSVTVFKEQLQPFFRETTSVKEAPWAKYSAFHKLINTNGMSALPRVYLPTTITSGGFKAGEANIGVVIDKNVALALTFKEMLLQSGRISTDNHLLIFPPDLGKVPGWSQLDFNFFWFDIIAGLKPDNAKLIELALRPNIDHQKYNDHTLSPAERMSSYKDFVRGFLALIFQNKLEIEPVSRLIQLLDPKSSLGCIVEESFARGLKIPVANVVINNMSAFPERDKLRELIRRGVDIPASRLSTNPDEPLLLVTQLPLM